MEELSRPTPYPVSTLYFHGGIKADQLLTLCKHYFHGGIKADQLLTLCKHSTYMEELSRPTPYPV